MKKITNRVNHHWMKSNHKLKNNNKHQSKKYKIQPNTIKVKKKMI